MAADVHAGGEAYEELGELYDAWCAEVDEDVPFYVGLAGALAHELGRPLDVVELGAGSGRITAPLAGAGHHVVGIDASAAQLERLGERVPAATAIHGDMRLVAELLPAESADLVLVPFRGMLHVTPEREQVLAAIGRVLRPSGVLAFDVFHPDAAQVGVTHGRWLHRRDEPTTTGQWRFHERASYRPELAAEPGGLKLEVDVRCRWKRVRRADPAATLADPPPGAPTERGTLLELQLVPVERWQASLLATGFAIDGSYGWFDARPLTDADDDSIWVARRGAD